MSRLREAQRCITNQLKYKNLNAFINIAEKDTVLKAAEDADEAGSPSPLTGRLIAVKDNICTKDLPTTAASGILKSFVSPYDATVVAHLRSAGAILAGKTNMDEFGMGSHSVNSFFGSVSQEDSQSAGGSSGGSAVAVASGQCWAALGTDTGGSVRLPAAYTGTVGFKPSYGLLSRWGVIAYANSLDTVGILGANVNSTRKIFEILNLYDSSDPTSLQPSTRKRLHELPGRRQKGTPLRIGVPAEYNIHSLSPAVRDTWLESLELLRKAGNSIHEINLPSTRQALSAYYVLAPAEASSNLAKYDGVRYGSRAEGSDGAGGTLFSQTRGTGFGDEVKRRILLGTYSLSSKAIDNYFIQAQKVRRLVQSDFNLVFQLSNPLLDPTSTTTDGVDIIVTPTSPTAPPKLEDIARQTPTETYMNDVFTVPASLAGLPAVSVPVRTKSQAESKVGIQLLGQFGDDELVLEAGELLESLQC